MYCQIQGGKASNIKIEYSKKTSWIRLIFTIDQFILKGLNNIINNKYGSKERDTQCLQHIRATNHRT
jgi:hypothetical protein